MQNTIMRPCAYIFLFLFIFPLSFCKKTAESSNGCFPADQAERQIINEQAIISMSGGKYFIYEIGTIDTRLVPCNLAKDFQVVGLEVTFSGYTKSLPQAVCCTESLVITKISR